VKNSEKIISHLASDSDYVHIQGNTIDIDQLLLGIRNTEKLESQLSDRNSKIANLERKISDLNELNGEKKKKKNNVDEIMEDKNNEVKLIEEKFNLLLQQERDRHYKLSLLFEELNKKIPEI